MPVRKTESRIPANFQASDFGEAVVAPDGRCALVSFITSPLVVNHENVYVLFVTNAGLAASAKSFEWTFSENDISTTETTEHGEISYTPRSTVRLSMIVRILGAANAEQAKLTLTQDVMPLDGELEALITSASNDPGPGLTNLDVVRELINDHNIYYQAVTLHAPEPGDAFKRFVFNMVFDGALQRTAAQRKQHIVTVAQSLNSQGTDFATLAGQGVGVSAIRLALLAMTLQKEQGNPTPLLNWTELPEPANKRDFADEQVRQTLAALDEAARIDLFNLARFPKSNITQCAHILESLRDRYFGVTNFNDVLTGMSGIRAQRIVQHYKRGPLSRS